MSDDNELCLLLLNERSDRVDAKAQHWRPLSGRVLTSLLSLLSALSQTSLLLLLRFWLVLVQEAEQVGSYTQFKTPKIEFDKASNLKENFYS